MEFKQRNNDETQNAILSAEAATDLEDQRLCIVTSAK
jgi:hypothetical protein